MHCSLSDRAPSVAPTDFLSVSVNYTFAMWTLRPHVHFYACTFLSTALKMPSAALTPLMFSVITSNQYSMPNKGGQSTAIILTLGSNVAFPEFKHELFKFRALVLSALQARKQMSSNAVPCQGCSVQTRYNK